MLPQSWHSQIWLLLEVVVCRIYIKFNWMENVVGSMAGSSEMSSVIFWEWGALSIFTTEKINFENNINTILIHFQK